MNDIVNEIDSLIDEQLAGGEPRQGFDYGDPTYPKCPHCERHWHGLRITEWIARMYDYGVFDEDYAAKSDQSRVLCEGSEFIGPMLAPPVGMYGGRRPLWWFNPNPSWELPPNPISDEQLVTDWFGAESGWHVLGTLADDGPTFTRPGWLDEMIDATYAYVADALGVSFGVPFRLWLPGDEHRNLPMPLRYAATHPQSPQAIVEVLNGGDR